MSQSALDRVFEISELSCAILQHCLTPRKKLNTNLGLRLVCKAWDEEVRRIIFQDIEMREVSYLNLLDRKQAIDDTTLHRYIDTVRTITLNVEDSCMGNLFKERNPPLNFDNLSRLACRSSEHSRSRGYSHSVNNQLFDFCGTAKTVNIQGVILPVLYKALESIRPKVPNAVYELEILDEYDSGTMFRKVLDVLSPPKNDGKVLIKELNFDLRHGLGWVCNTLNDYPYLWSCIKRMDVSLNFFFVRAISEQIASAQSQPLETSLEHLRLELDLPHLNKIPPLVDSLFEKIKKCSNLASLEIYYEYGIKYVDDSWVAKLSENKPKLRSLTLTCVSWGEPVFTIKTLEKLKGCKQLRLLSLENELYKLKEHEQLESRSELAEQYREHGKLIDDSFKFSFDFSQLGEIGGEVWFPNLELLEAPFYEPGCVFPRDVMKFHMPSLNVDKTIESNLAD